MTNGTLAKLLYQLLYPLLIADGLHEVHVLMRPAMQGQRSKIVSLFRCFVVVLPRVRHCACAWSWSWS